MLGLLKAIVMAGKSQGSALRAIILQMRCLYSNFNLFSDIITVMTADGSWTEESL